VKDELLAPLHQPQGCRWRREQLRPRRVGNIASNGDSHCHGLESAARNFDNTDFTFTFNTNFDKVQRPSQPTRFVKAATY
jgi:hypothetical protein